MVLFFVSDGRRNPALGRARMGTRGKDLADNGDVPAPRAFHGRPQPRQSRPDDHDVMLDVHRGTSKTFTTEGAENAEVKDKKNRYALAAAIVI
jgi:hypothetical protein